MMRTYYIIGIMCGLILVGYVVANEWFLLADVQRYALLLRDAVEHHYLISALAYIVLFIVAYFFVLPVTVLLTLAGGYLFGVIMGGLYALIGTTVGSLVLFSAVRYGLYSSYGLHTGALRTEIEQHGHYYLLSLQLLPVTPSFPLTVAAALSSVSRLTFAWTTFVGNAPGVIIYSLYGNRFLSITRVADLYDMVFVSVSILLVGLACVPLVVRYMQRSRRN